MTLTEIIQAAKLSNEKAFGGIGEQRALAIVRTTLGELGKQIKAAKAGEKVALTGFGTFVIGEKEVEKDGQKAIRRKVMFRQAASKADKAGKAGKTGKAGKSGRAAPVEKASS